MELWIRNQDKDGLYKVDEVYIDERDYGNNDISYYIRESGVLLGRYTTKKRALEVLDEIQNILKPKLKIVQTDDMSLPIMNGEWVNSIREKMEFDTIQLSVYVYNMPEE